MSKLAILYVTLEIFAGGTRSSLFSRTVNDEERNICGFETCVGQNQGSLTEGEGSVQLTSLY
jgi:hypothetical protein